MSDLALITADVERHRRSETPIYSGTAKAIAQSWVIGDSDMSRLYFTGAIGESLIPEIRENISYVAEYQHRFDPHKRVQDVGTARHTIAQLNALMDYADRAGIRGPVNNWSSVRADELAPEDEYNTDYED